MHPLSKAPGRSNGEHSLHRNEHGLRGMPMQAPETCMHLSGKRIPGSWVARRWSWMGGLGSWGRHNLVPFVLVCGEGHDWMRAKAGPAKKQDLKQGPSWLGQRAILNKNNSVEEKTIFSNIKIFPIIVNVSPWRVFVAEINIWNDDLWVKQIALHNVGGPHLISWRSEQNEKNSRPKQEDILQKNAFGLHLHHQFTQASCLLSHSADFGLVKPLPSLSLYHMHACTRTCTNTNTHTHPIDFFLWRND